MFFYLTRNAKRLQSKQVLTVWCKKWRITMKDELSEIRQIMSELEVLNDDYSDYTLPEKLEEKLLKVQDNLLQTWAAKPANLEEILDFHYRQARTLMSLLSPFNLDKSNPKSYVKGEDGFRDAVNVVLMEGLLSVIRLVMYIRDCENPGLI